MITENLSTLKIHKLSQEQYNRELAAGRLDENALYLTPDIGSGGSGDIDASQVLYDGAREGSGCFPECTNVKEVISEIDRLYGDLMGNMVRYDDINSMSFGSQNITYDGNANGGEQVQGSTVKEALDSIDDNLTNVWSQLDGKADESHGHASEDIVYTPSEPEHGSNVAEALSYLFAHQGTGGSGATDASQISYDGSEQFIGGTTVQEALDSASNHIISMQSTFSGHEHSPEEIEYYRMTSSGVGTTNIAQALDALFDEVDGFSEALDELHAYAQGLVNGGGAE